MFSCGTQRSPEHIWGLTPDIREVWSDWDVVDPRLQLWVEELQPLFSNVEDERTTQEKVFQTETGSHSPEIKQIPLKGEAKRGTWSHLAFSEEMHWAVGLRGGEQMGVSLPLSQAPVAETKARRLCEAPHRQGELS